MSSTETSGDYRFPNGLIQVFTKAPVLGQVKTRLRESLSDAEIIELYKQMLNGVISTVLGARICPLELRVASELEHEFFLPYVNNEAVSVKLQSEGDLGQRMAGAFKEALLNKRFVIAVGGDCVSIDTDYLFNAARLLTAGQSVVLGPAEDGGYVLLGMRELYADIFKGIPWGEADVLRTTVQKLAQNHVNYSLLGVGWDVDTPEDLRRYQMALQQGSRHNVGPGEE